MRAPAMDVIRDPGQKTLEEIYGPVSKEMLDAMLARNNMTLGMKYAMRDAHLTPQKTLAQFRAEMREYGLHPALHNERRALPAWAARAAALPPDTPPHQVYEQYPETVLVDEGW